MTRTEYDRQIEQLRDDVVVMASMVDKAIARSIDALRRQDIDLAQELVAADKDINQQRWQAEERALMLIATQGPMARDLRMIAASMHIVSEMERMGDHAAGIGKIVLQTASEALLKPLVDIPRMGEIARSMLNDSVKAFIEQDVDSARLVARRDDDLDELYEQVYRELLTYMMAKPDTINRATHLLWAAHNVERIGDRVTNVCERVIFTVTGGFEEMDGRLVDYAEPAAESGVGASANGTSG